MNGNKHCFIGIDKFKRLWYNESINWKDMKGKDMKSKAIRIYGTWNRIEAIGHIINDDWFIPSLDFRS